MRRARLCLALSILLLAPSHAAALQPGPGVYRVDWFQAPFAVPMWLVQCTGTCPNDGLFLVTNPQAIPAGAVRVLGGPYRNGGDLFLDRSRLLQAGLPPQALRVDVLDAGGRRVDGLVLAAPAELGRRAAEVMANADAPRAPERGAQTNASTETPDDDDVIVARTPSEASRLAEAQARAAGLGPADPYDGAIVAMTPSDASRIAEAQARNAGPQRRGDPGDDDVIVAVTPSEASRAAEAQARAEGYRPRPPCGFPHGWRVDLAGRGSYVLRVDASGRVVTEGGGQATLTGNQLTIQVARPDVGLSGRYRITLEATCSGAGQLTFDSLPAEYAAIGIRPGPVAFISLGP